MPTLAREATRQRAASDILMQVVVRVLNLGLGVVVTGLLVRALGSTRYGQWSTLLVVVSLLGYFATFGMEEAALREAARAPEDEFEWLGAIMALRLILLGPLLAVSVLAVFLLHQSEQMLIAGLVLVSAMPFGGVGTLAILFKLRVDNRVPMIEMTVRSLLWGAAVLIVYLEHGTLIELAIAMVATGLISHSIQAVLALRLVGRWPRPSRARLPALVRVGVPLGISGMLTIAYGRIDQVIVFTVAGAKQAGLYAAVYTVLERAHFVPQSILTTLNPVLAASWPSDRERLLRAARQAAELLAIASLGGLAFAIAAAGPVVHLIFGPSFAQAAPALPVLGAAFVMISYGYLNDVMLATLGHVRKRMTIALTALVVNVAANLALVPVFGFMAAAWITLATETLIVVLAAVRVRHVLGLPLIPRTGRVGRTFLAAAVLAGALGAVRVAGGGLPILIATACVLYPALLLALRAVAVADVRLVLRRSPA
jgi:O-antigen/teichoic acid export membrane protein